MQQGRVLQTSKKLTILLWTSSHQIALYIYIQPRNKNSHVIILFRVVVYWWNRKTLKRDGGASFHVPLHLVSCHLSSHDAHGKHTHQPLLQLLLQSPLQPCACGSALGLSLPHASHADIYLYNHSNKFQLRALKLLLNIIEIRQLKRIKKVHYFCNHTLKITIFQNFYKSQEISLVKPNFWNMGT